MSRELEERQRKLEEELTHQFQEVSEKAVEVGKQALVIAGGVFVAYQLVKLLSKSKKKKQKPAGAVYQKVLTAGEDNTGRETIIIKEASSSKSNLFWEDLKAEFGAMLMGLVKAKIFEALEKLNQSTSSSEEDER